MTELSLSTGSAKNRNQLIARWSASERFANLSTQLGMSASQPARQTNTTIQASATTRLRTLKNEPRRGNWVYHKFRDGLLNVKPSGKEIALYVLYDNVKSHLTKIRTVYSKTLKGHRY